MNLKTELQSHQEAAVEKLKPTRIGALFMEMGTGKSRTAIELVAQRLNKIDKVVWFCPVSLKETIKQEIKKHTGQDAYVFNNKTNKSNIPPALWYIVGIESMSSSKRIVVAVNKLITEKTFVILDESSYIKGHSAMRTQRLIYICERAYYRLILTGTPVSQGVVDLYSQMKFLSPKILGYNSFYSFAANHLEYSDKYPGMIVQAHNTEYIAAKIQPYVYQVTKKDCIYLPQKIYESRYFCMTWEQRDYYELAKNEILDRYLDDMDNIAIFKLFTALQQIISGYWNRRIYEESGIPKEFDFIEFKHERLNLLLEVISSIPKDKKVIIWAKFNYDINQIYYTLLKNHKQSEISLFYGKLNEKERNNEIKKFRKNAKFLVATQSSGGHGLTLNEANYVIFYNNAFKYSERLQAEDRCHRIGQEKPVTYIDIVCINSIDERINNSLSKKENIVDSFKKEINTVKDDNKTKELIKNL